MASGKSGGRAGLLGYAILYLAFLYAPVLFLPLFSFNDSVFIAFPLSGFTTQWYEQMFSDDAMLHVALLDDEASIPDPHPYQKCAKSSIQIV